ncbi:hypothetical protein JAAARDRAFT_40409 [Jaapia argillacea MUCL 33604]|uniref:Uncharacterized protein n=1 Tax=Jaapia argillacea MUCL 33604 TaxID=933084 RepID=A0A067PEM1_9AGAM|nr:hypothetical protein JAAARDRAFT_40409 [Jaapia argillacea MUCL 33604]
MPHKRAKRSVREKERNEKGHDLAPRSSNSSSMQDESLPKGMARVLNAAKVREDYRKRRLDEEDGGETKKRRKVDTKDGKAEKTKAKEKGKGAVHMEILPGESLYHFNQRVEDNMRPLVKSAAQASSAHERRKRKEALESTKSLKTPTGPKTKVKPGQDDSSPPPPDELPSSKRHTGPTEFLTLSSSAPKRLNDIAQAPPEIKVKKRKPLDATSSSKHKPKHENVLSLYQEQMMEEEREKVIRRYREMKAKKVTEGGWGGERGGGEEDDEQVD